MSYLLTTVTPAIGVPSAFVHSEYGGKPTTPLFHGDPRTIGSVDSGTGGITFTDHGLAVGDRIVFATDGVLPSPLSDDDYFVVALRGGDEENTFYVSTEAGGDILTFDDSGTGTHTWNLAAAPMAEIDDWLESMNSTGPAIPEGTYPYAIAKIAEWKTFYASGDYTAWWAGDQAERYKQFANTIKI